MQIIKVDITPGYDQSKIIYVSQYDVGREFKVVLTDGTSGYTIPAGAKAKFQGTKPSTLGFSVEGVISGNEITFEATEEMTDEAGRIPVEISVTYGDKVIGSKNIYLDVEETPHDPSTTDGSAGQVIAIITILVQEAKKAASDSEAYAIGKRGGVPVSADDPAFNNNSKFYSEVIGQQAATAGYMHLDIVDGDMYYTRSDNVDVDFELINGDLYMITGTEESE